MSDDLRDRIVEAAARAIAGERSARTAAIEALAAAVREAGLDAEDLTDGAAFFAGAVRRRREYERENHSAACEVAITNSMDRTAAFLRALAGIADADA